MYTIINAVFRVFFIFFVSFHLLFATYVFLLRSRVISVIGRMAALQALLKQINELY